jgi:hypothetical protein
LKSGLKIRRSSNRLEMPAQTAPKASRAARTAWIWRVLLALFALGSVASASEAWAAPKAPKKKRAAARHRATTSHRRPAPALGPPGSPAARYGALTAEACLAELDRRGIAFKSEAQAPGVKIPVRLLGPVGGVVYRTDEPDAARRASPWEVFDCRLVLSLCDFGEILAKHEVVEARIFSAWRPPPKSFQGSVGRRHQGGLAVDVRTFRKQSGEELVILHHFEGRMGASVCESGRKPSHPEGKELLSIACGAADAHLFNSILTPNYDVPHRNHFHLELTPDVGWFMLR